jgi:transposase
VLSVFVIGVIFGMARGELTEKQKDVAALLCDGMNNVQASKKSGVSRVTIAKWKRLPEFDEYYQQLASDRALLREKHSLELLKQKEKNEDKFPNLTQKQRDAAGYLCQGLLVIEVAKLLKVSRVTISNWKKIPEFQDYYQSVVEQYEKDRKKAASKITIQEACDRQTMLQQWRQKRIEVNEKIIQCGLVIVEKMLSRIMDLPDEVFGPSNIAPLLKVGGDLIQTGMEEWGTAIDLKDMKPTRTAEIEAIQKLADSEVLPQSVREEITEALDEFQRKAITALSAANPVKDVNNIDVEREQPNSNELFNK